MITYKMGTQHGLADMAEMRYFYDKRKIKIMQ